MQTEVYYTLYRMPVSYEIPSRWFQNNDAIFDKIKQRHERNKWRNKTKVYKSNKRR